MMSLSLAMPDKSDLVDPVPKVMTFSSNPAEALRELDGTTIETLLDPSRKIPRLSYLTMLKHHAELV